MGALNTRQHKAMRSTTGGAYSRPQGHKATIRTPGQVAQRRPQGGTEEQRFDAEQDSKRCDRREDD